MANDANKFSKKTLITNGLGTVGHMTRNNLERLGNLMDNLNAQTNKTSKYNAVDLDKFDASSSDNLFSQQTLKASEQLIGNRFATYGKYAKKVVPDSIFQRVTDSAFVQVAKLAAKWSEIDLPNEHRFEGIQNLSDQERNALARDIANQNRALAILGSVTGLAGLPGLLADTLWLLLVSLRSVYQLATVYDKPLTGKQGVKMAYAVLSKADLSKMQEKQAILAGLGMAKGLLDNADNRGFRDELKNMGVKNENVRYYAEQVDKLTEQFDVDIDNINLGWITKLLPLSSVGVGAHYNHHLINEVIGVANATFGPAPKIAREANVAIDNDNGNDNGKVNDDKVNDNDNTDDAHNSDTGHNNVDNSDVNNRDADNSGNKDVDSSGNEEGTTSEPTDDGLADEAAKNKDKSLSDGKAASTSPNK